MNANDTFFSDLLAEARITGEWFVEPDDEPDPVIFDNQKPAWRLKLFGAVCAFTFFMVPPERSVSADSMGEPTQQEAKVQSEVQRAQETMASHILQGFVRDHYISQADNYANMDMVPECEAAVLELAKVSIGPVSFDCDLSD